ncbi:NUDIX hydrolase [Amycolatopsis suaedae]|uniref:NUDIX domain-containing protein n=1 Tax=Amycolatopsis suaedae TaxID=2510978 RepID=A0A4Q7J6V9_9PSEU|nr:NUDIX domain-containing protein [Amycolatopsis suaedae]
MRCVGGVIRAEDGRLLLVKRANAPGAGQWSLPGGRVEPGESDADAVVREMREETGLLVTPGALAGMVVRGPFHIYDYHCTVRAGTPAAGDDAADVRWVSRADLDTLDLVDGLFETLASWDCLPHP